MAIRLKVAKTATELDDVFKLRHQVYVEERGKFSSAEASNPRITDHFDALPDVANIIAYAGTQAIACMRVNRDSEIGLPAEHYFNFTEQRKDWTLQYGLDLVLVSPSMLAVHPQWRKRRNVLFALFKCAAGVMHSWGATHVVGSISLETHSLYGRMGFRACGDSQWVSSVGDDLLPISARFCDVFDWAFSLMGQDVGDFWLDHFCGKFERLLLSSGEVLFEQGDEADYTYAVDRGWVSISRQDPEGNEMVLANLARGALFGELAVFDGAGRSAKAVAVGNLELVAIPRDALFDTIKQHPDNLFALLKHFAKRVRETDELAMVQAFSPQASRVAFTLNQLWQSASQDSKKPDCRVVSLGPEQIARAARVREYEVRNLLEICKADGSLEYGENSIRFFQPPQRHCLSVRGDSPI